MKMKKRFVSGKWARRLGVAALLLCISWARSTCFAASSKEEIPSISFDQFPFAIKRFYFFSDAGTPVAEAKEMNGPGPDDFPPHSVVFLEDLRRYPSLEKGHAVYMMPARNVIRVYNISAVTTAPYKTIQSHIKQLRALLKTRPTTVPSGGKQGNSYAKYEQLPDYPPRNAGHLVQVKINYLDARWGSGLFYVTQFVQGTGEWPDNEQLVYLLQALSKDERFCVAADFRITHASLDGAEVSREGESDADALTEKLSSIMAKDRDESFTPPLNKIREWVSTFKIE
jgi:hypothetical protein